MRFEVLGPFRVYDGSRSVPISCGLQGVLLGTLLSKAGMPVSTSELIDALWGANPPQDPQRDLRVTVTRLRRRLGDTDRIALTSGRYVVRLTAGELDATEFDEGIQRARTAHHDGDLPAAADLLDRALRLWRGTPYGGLEDNTYLFAAIQRISDLRVEALERRADIDLARNRYGRLITDLPGLIAEYRYHERFVAQLMTALCRTGRRAEALVVYRSAYDRLNVDHGVEPGAELQNLHQRVLLGEFEDPLIGCGVDDDPDAGLLAARLPVPVDPSARYETIRIHPRSDMQVYTRLLAPTAPIPIDAVTVVPRQLPADAGGFAGRDDALEALDKLVGASIVVVSGTAGVGKTALALHWAHRVASQFPDGQIYLNLRGFEPAGQPMSPAEALRCMLSALQVTPQQIPAGVVAQAALYRSLLAGRRFLVVLDNARDAEQVRHLLPGSPDCMAVVTSRDYLYGLVAAGASPVALDPMSADEARRLLAHRLGAERVTAEPRAADEIAVGCSRLPLALSIVAARAICHPSFGLEDFATELRDAHDRLDVLSGQDMATDIRAVFSSSYQALGAEAARLFRLLGLHPGSDIAASTAASLAGLEIRRARSVLAELDRAHLIAQLSPCRFVVHDLLRTYAAELVQDQESDVERHAALRRMMCHYVHTAHRAALLVSPYRAPVELDPELPGVTFEPLVGCQHAIHWYRAEHDALLAAIKIAADIGLHNHVWQLAWAFIDFSHPAGHWQDWVGVLETAVDGDRRLAGRAARAIANRLLAHAYSSVRRYDEATQRCRTALDLSREIADKLGLAHALHGFGVVLAQEGRLPEALEYGRRSLSLFKAAGHQFGEAAALDTVGWYHVMLGAPDSALICFRRALGLFERLEHRLCQAGAWERLGGVHLRLGDRPAAIDSYQHALTLYRALGYHYRQAGALTYLGDLHQAAGDTKTARDSWRQSIDLLEELGHPDANRVRLKLRRHSPVATTR